VAAFSGWPGTTLPSKSDTGSVCLHKLYFLGNTNSASSFALSFAVRRDLKSLPFSIYIATGWRGTKFSGFILEVTISTIVGGGRPPELILMY